MTENIIFIILGLIVVIPILLVIAGFCIEAISDGSWMLAVWIIAAICLCAIYGHLDDKEQAQKELTIHCCKQCEVKKNG